MPERTARTTGGRAITRDLQAADATTTTTQGADLGYLLGVVHGIAILRDRDRNGDRDKGRDRIQNRNKDRPRQVMKVCEAVAKARRVRTKYDLIKYAVLLVPTWTMISLPYNLTIQAFHARSQVFYSKKLKFETTQQSGQRYEIVS